MVAYGDVTAGEVLVLLHIELNNARTLHYYLCASDKGTDVVTDDEVGPEIGSLRVPDYRGPNGKAVVC